MIGIGWVLVVDVECLGRCQGMVSLSLLLLVPAILMLEYMDEASLCWSFDSVFCDSPERLLFIPCCYIGGSGLHPPVHIGMRDIVLNQVSGELLKLSVGVCHE